MNKVNRLTIIVFLLFEFILLINALQTLGGKPWKDLGLTILAMGVLTLPFLLNYFAKRVKLKLPPGFILIGLVFILLAQYLGELKNFYQTLWWWDLLLHGAFGALAVLFALYILKSNLRSVDQISKTKFTVFLAILSICFSIAASALWELFEYLGDIILPVKMVKGGLEDSMTDLLIGAFCAILTALGYLLIWRFASNEKN